MKLIFFMQINTKLSYKVIPLILVDMARPAQTTKNKFSKSFLLVIATAQTTQNSKFPISLQYLYKAL